MNALRSAVPLLFLTSMVRAQTAPPPAPPQQGAAPTGETVTLSAFEVRSESDTGYVASSAMSGTRTNELLENMPNSISVMTQEFLQDLAMNSYFDAVDFAMNAENIANDLGTVGAVVGNRGGNQVNIRGLASVRQLRDGFPWYLSTDSYNTERIEFSRGPGGLAYGDVDAGGSINIGSKRANFQRRASVQVRYDSFGTQRYSLDTNQPLVPGRAGVRFNAIKSEVEMFKQRMGRDLEGYALAFRLEPFKDRRTQIDVFGERGHTTYHLGHLGPTDSRIAYLPGTGNSNLDADPNRAGTQVNGVGMQQLRAPTAVAHAFVEVGGVINNWQSTTTNTFRITTTNTAAAATSATDPQNPNRYPLRRIPESIIPLREDWAGPDNKMSSKYHAYTVELKHAFSNRLSGLVAFNAQFDETQRKQTYSSLASVGGVAGRSVHVDVNPILPNPNGAGTVTNPNYGQMYIVHAPLFNPDGHDIMGWRGQVVYDAKLPWGITQRIVAGVNYRHEENYQDNYGYSLTKEEIAKRGYTTGQAAYFNNSLVYPIHYLRDGNSDRELGWSVRPGLTQLFRHNAGSGVNRRLDQSLMSGSVNLLGSYFGGQVRTSLGLSRDHWLQSASLPTTADTTNFNQQTFFNADGSRIPNDGLRKLDVPVFPFADDWSTNQTYGAVWHVRPWLSFTAGYFESSQFSDNYGTDLTGGALMPLTGEGADFSARLKLLGGKLELTVTRFATKQENLNATLDAAVRDELAPLLAKPFANLVDYRDRTAKGWEFQIAGNITRSWTVLAGYSNNQTEFTRFFPLLGAFLTEARATAKARGLDPDGATALTMQYLEDQEGVISLTKRATASLTTRYSFTEGRLKGANAGVAARWARGRDRAGVTISGVQVLPPITTEAYLLVNPFVSYRRKLGRYNVTAQLNVNNAFDVKVDVGNGYTWTRYTEPRQYVTTVTVGF
ncbi:MAG: TonB-dependent receptor plug domain-containing protein [Verrucomicrobia bacterium]|nr:TonB-dependent receptor plug domain-containing protein [Verrucomicrobiota bacterium]